MTALIGNPVFEGISPEHRAEVIAASRLCTYQAGASIVLEGQPCEAVYALERGRVRVFHAVAGGAEIMVKAFGAPAIFGEDKALSGIAYLESVAALTQCTVLEIPAARFVSLVQSEPSVSLALCVDLAARLAISSYDEKSIAFDPATVRLANYLLDYAGWISEDPTSLKIDLTQDDMAKAIGVTRRSIAKDIASWQEERILRKSAGGYRVVDIEGLKRYADPQRLTLHYSLRRGMFPLKT